MLIKVFAGLVALVAVVSLMSGPRDAATTAGKGMSTIGITAGAIIGSIPALITGFNNARDAGGGDPAPANRPAVDRARG